MAIRIDTLTKSFGKQPVLRGVSLDIRDGELIALLGASGSGKTTLLRILAGLEWPDAGELSVDGESWLGRPAQTRGVGFVPQHYALFGHLTVAENIAFGLRVRDRKSRPSDTAIEAKVKELLVLMQLDGLSQRYPSQLSGGQRQRVALARALAIEPKVLLLDAPFGALDARVRKDLRLWLRQVHRQLGTTTVFVTHDQEEALELADRVALLHEGRVEQIGTPEDIYDRPATPYVLRFLGGVNELPGQVSAGRVEIDGVDTSALGHLASGDGHATLFVRPHDIDVQPVHQGGSVLDTVVIAGNQARLAVAVGHGRPPIEAQLGRDVVRARGLAAGQRVRLSALSGRLFVDGGMTESAKRDADCMPRP